MSLRIRRLLLLFIRKNLTECVALVILPAVCFGGYNHQHGSLKADANTTLLWDIVENSTDGVADSSGHLHAGKFSETVTLVDDQYSKGYQGYSASMVDSTQKIPADIFSNTGAGAIAEGAFTIDMLMRFDATGGYWLLAGPVKGNSSSFKWGMLLRGAGHMEIRGSGLNTESEPIPFALKNYQALEKIGPVDFSRFYHYALSFDGEKTFRVYVDGTLIWEEKLPDGLSGLKLHSNEIRVGDAVRWKSQFGGDVATFRLSNIERSYEPVKRTYPYGLEDAYPDYRFDMGPADGFIEEGCLAVTPATVYNSKRGYGWVEQPVGAWDYWFAPGGRRPLVKHALENNTHGTLTWLNRDGVTVSSGSTFRADIPAGEYVVIVSVGHQRKRTQTKDIIVNGQPFGESLKVLDENDEPYAIRTDFDSITNQNERRIRGIMNVGSGGLEVVFNGIADEPVEVIGIEAYPWEAPLVQKTPGVLELKWMGQGDAPSGFAEAAKSYSEKRFKDAVVEADKITDPLVRATVWAWILGYPTRTEPFHEQLCARIIHTLQDYLEKNPDSVQALDLLKASEDLYTAIRVKLDQGKGTNKLFGGHPWRWWQDGAYLSLQFDSAEPYYGHGLLIGSSLMDQYIQQAGGMTGPYEYNKPQSHWGNPFPTDFYAETVEAYPDSTLARIYAGESVPLDKQIPIPAGAPKWAALQHRVLVRVLDVIHYWIDERMDSKGYMGGGLGDDVETFRWWSVAHMVADDEKAREGWRKLADTAWGATKGLGYWTETRISDVEHGSEPLSDTHTFLPFIDYGTPRFEEVLERQAVIKDRVLNYWTAINPQGYRMFKSTHYSATTIDDRRSGDHFYNVRAANPALMMTWFNNDPEITKFILDWGTSWRDAILDEGEGKPAGIYPVIVTFDDRSFTMADNKPWYDPGYYDFPRGGDRIYDVLNAAYELSGDQKYLDPHRALLTNMSRSDIDTSNSDAGGEGGSVVGSRYRAVSATKLETENPIGSNDWALEVAQRQIGLIGARYRIVSEDQNYNELLSNIAPPVTKSRLAFENASTPEEKQQAMMPIENELGRALGNLDYNWPLRTTEPKSTDRVWIGGTEAVIAMATGTALIDAPRGAERQWPLFGVTWRNTGADVSIFVIENRHELLSGFLYNFSDKNKAIGAQIWRLEPGNYHLRVGRVDSVGDYPSRWFIERDISVKNKGQVVEIEVPSREQVWFEFKHL